MISLNGTQIQDPNEYSVNKNRIRGRHLTMQSGFQAYSKQYKYSVRLSYNNITESQRAVIDNIYQNQFVDFDTVNLVMADGYPDGDLNIEVFMRIDNLEYNVNGRYRLELSFEEK
jgi:hypothetical protein